MGQTIFVQQSNPRPVVWRTSVLMFFISSGLNGEVHSIGNAEIRYEFNWFSIILYLWFSYRSKISIVRKMPNKFIWLGCFYLFGCHFYAIKDIHKRKVGGFCREEWNICEDDNLMWYRITSPKLSLYLSCKILFVWSVPGNEVDLLRGRQEVGALRLWLKLK